MRYLKYAALSAAMLGALLLTAGHAQAAQVHVGVGIGIGPEPVCAYGYYPYAPYACAPYGYWGPDYFLNGVFVGIGPWYHSHWYGHGYYGRPGFYGHGYGYGYRGGYRGGNFHGYNGGGFHGNAGFHGGGGYHGGGGFHGGGGHGGGGHR